ncbi:MAG TPA: asparagine synthase (glutamine-hydrolyzing) [Gammaproteobacteria bacterium]|nr:asparagine synthase (glutamine-hydrolyzing) [Gammaproteobacteria bacterium]
MCGIAGFVGLRTDYPSERLAALARRMSDQLAHRGPDDAGIFVNERAQVGLGFRRLAIIDLSPEGHQPMRSPSGRYHLVFNGEIYNFPELRDELEAQGHEFRGRSDTEALLAAIEAWGLPKALERAKGMLALALWDEERRELSLARDRAGKKPVYYGWTNGRFAFASELKAIRALPAFSPTINRDALTLLLRHNYIPAPYSIYEGIFKLRQGEMLTLPVEALPPRPDYNALDRYRRRYWAWTDAVRAGAEEPYEGDAQQACADLERCLQGAVRSRMVADVPLGALLSGGIDSSIVAALMQNVSPTPVKTFSIGFHEKDYNEAGFAKQVAAHLGTDHTELYVSPREAMDLIPALPAIYDEPLADVSQIPTHMVSRLARKHVTVALSGDGGDELFAGYTRYLLARKLLRLRSLAPPAARGALAALIERVPAQRWDALLRPLGALAPSAPGDKLHKGADLLRSPDPVALYRDLFSQWRNPGAVVNGGVEPPTPLTDATGRPPVADFVERMMQLDGETYLPENILMKVDRASMAVSLEVRCPLLDPDVIAFAWRLPLHFKLRDGRGKWLLRRLLYRYVPEQLIERPKMGFDVPIGRWLRGNLRDWAEDLLDQDKLVRQGFLEPQAIRRRWREHLQGIRNWQYPLWNVLMFQAWLEQSGPTVFDINHHGVLLDSLENLPMADVAVIKEGGSYEKEATGHHSVSHRWQRI